MKEIVLLLYLLFDLVKFLYKVSCETKTTKDVYKRQIEDIAIMLKNLEEAKAFCKEFYERRDEFI